MTNQSPQKAHPLNRLWQFATGHRRQTLLAIVCSVLNKIFDLAPPVLIGAAVDVVVAQQDSIVAQFGFPEVSTQLWILAILTVIIWGLESVFEYAFSVLWRNLAQTLQHELRVETYGHVQTLEMAYFEDRSTGGLMSVLNDDINQLERFLDVGANEVLQVLTTVIVIGAMFFVMAPTVAWMSFLPMPFIFWGSMRFQKEIAPRYAEVRERVGQLNGQLSNNLSGIATIKSFTAEKFEEDRIGQESDEYRTSNRRAIRLSSAFVPLIRMLIVMGFVATLVYGGTLVIDGRLNVGAYSIMVFMTQRLLWPLTRLGQTIDLYQRAMASTNRVMDLLDTEAKIVGGNVPLPSVRGEVTSKRFILNTANRTCPSSTT